MEWIFFITLLIAGVVFAVLTIASFAAQMLAGELSPGLLTLAAFFAVISVVIFYQAYLGAPFAVVVVLK